MNFHSQDNLRLSPDIRGTDHPSLQSQYSASPIMRKLIRSYMRRVDPGVDIELFYAEIFNIMTARGLGLDIWGRILGVGRLLEVASEDCFGFSGSGLLPFNQGVFHIPGRISHVRLADQPYRRLLLFKALANISSSDAATINHLLNELFENRKLYIIETGVMAIRFVFEFSLEPWERSMFRNYGVLTRGAGVYYDWIEVKADETFGFAGSGLLPFNQGVFSAAEIVTPR